MVADLGFKIAYLSVITIIICIAYNNVKMCSKFEKNSNE